MPGPGDDSERTLAVARESLARQRAARRSAAPIGKRSAERRRDHRLRKAGRVAVALAAIVIATIGAGLLLGGIGLTGLFLAVVTAVIAVLVLGTWPRLAIPEVGSLNRGDIRTLVGNTELWLESRRPALPPAAAALVDRIGGQLDVLGVQLEGLTGGSSEAAELRKLIGESLPDVVATYTRIPTHLRSERQGGSSPDEQIAESLGRISDEIARITRHLAAGEVDGLAIRTRYLDYKYGETDKTSAKP